MTTMELAAVTARAAEISHIIKEYTADDAFSRKFSTYTLAHAPLMVELTDDPALLHQYQLMRDNLSINSGAATEYQGKEDGFDKASEVIIASLERLCIGGVRVTGSSPYLYMQLPLEKSGRYKLSDLLPALELDQKGYAEFSKLALLPDYDTLVIRQRLYRKMFEAARQKGFHQGFLLTGYNASLAFMEACIDLGVAAEIQTELPDALQYADGECQSVLVVIHL